jgi:hypothetical protein
MPYQLSCPGCRTSLYFPTLRENDDLIAVLCPRCRYKYGLQVAQVQAFTSRVETLPKNRDKTPPDCQRVYNLRLRTPAQKLKALRLETPGPREQISALAGDELLLLYTLHGTTPDELIWLENTTTGNSHLLHPPGRKARDQGIIAGFATLIGGGILTMLLQLPNRVYLPIAIPAAIGAGAYVTRSKDTRCKDQQELAQLTSEQHLLKQIHDLEDRIQELKQEAVTQEKTIIQLQALRQKMLDTRTELYPNPAETFAKGVAVMEQQLNLTQNLIDGYQQIAAILEIEHETFRLTNALPEELSATIVSRMAELEAIAQKREELALLVDPTRLLAKPDYLG